MFLSVTKRPRGATWKPKEPFALTCGSQRGFPDKQFSASPGNLLEMKILGPHSRPIESETLGCAQQPGLTSTPSDSEECKDMRSSSLKKLKEWGADDMLQVVFWCQLTNATFDPPLAASLPIPL